MSAGIYDPDVYVEGPPHDLYAELRATQPVFWQGRQMAAATGRCCGTPT